jgi:hypothetical protein
LQKHIRTKIATIKTGTTTDTTITLLKYRI